MARRTPLFDAHRALGARLVEFAGWEMPLCYRGAAEEHRAVRNRCGLFDVSHMGEIELRGPAVGERHLPPRELDQARAERAMGVEERRAAGHARAQSACSAALTVLASSIATVIGPTPPGTGVM